MVVICVVLAPPRRRRFPSRSGRFHLNRYAASICDFFGGAAPSSGASEERHRAVIVLIGQAWEGFSSARSLGVHPPSLTHVYVSDVDALHQRARAAGAEVTDLEMAPVGDRRFTATDPEGQVWVFAQRVASPAS